MKTLFITCAAVLSISFAQEYGMMDHDEMEHDNDKRRQRMESMMQKAFEGGPALRSMREMLPVIHQLSLVDLESLFT